MVEAVLAEKNYLTWAVSRDLRLMPAAGSDELVKTGIMAINSLGRLREIVSSALDVLQHPTNEKLVYRGRFYQDPELLAVKMVGDALRKAREINPPSELIGAQLQISKISITPGMYDDLQQSVSSALSWFDSALSRINAGIAVHIESDPNYWQAFQTNTPPASEKVFE